MKGFKYNFDKLLEHRIRLGIMSALMVNDWVEFNQLKEVLHLTDGNLASHLNTLEKNEYIQIRKEFVGKKPKTTYAVTTSGRKAFTSHLDALENFINAQK